jgi:pyruvate/2-oxoglutarate dehydrogenase complex dihydrolipoamide dehydrogenase (E3) component
MTETIHTDICVIGGGSGGLSVAASAVQMGAATVLVERAAMGGDCLNYGCVPSKALLAAGRAAQAVRDTGNFGIRVGTDGPQVDFAAVNDHVKGVIDSIAPHDSVERFEGLGVRVIKAEGSFVDRATVAVGDAVIKARRFVVATGSSPTVPPIAGIDKVPYLTNETIFANRTAMDHLVVIGGGPIGVEMAQAHRHLGVRVTVVEIATILPNDDPELVDVLRQALRRQGIDIREGVTVAGLEQNNGGVRVRIVDQGREDLIEGSHFLLATGRTANLGALELSRAGIEFDNAGIRVDARLRTTNRRIFAIGDAAAGYKFTHVAGYQAGIVIRNALFRLPAKADYRALPWVTYATPELAQVGMTEIAARAAHGTIRVLRSLFSDNDRATAERNADGLVKVITTARGVVVGAGMVGPDAGELIQSWCLPIAKGLKIKDVAGLILPYPTLGEINKRAAGSYFTPALFGSRTRWLVRLLAKFG